MKREFRLTQSTDFKRVRRLGKSYAHPLVVLIALPNEDGRLRFGVAAGRNVGGAVQRNRAKRLIRAALTPLVERITPGWDVLILARQPLAASNCSETQAALDQLIRRAKLFGRNDAGRTSFD